MDKKEDINIFFCDIRGTIVSKDETKEDKNLEELIRNLEEIKRVDDLNNLYFSFVSSEHMDRVLEYANKLKPYLENSSITLGPLFSSAHLLYKDKKSRCENGKCMQMAFLIEKMKEKGDFEVGKIYFADDTKLYHKVLKKYASEKKLAKEYQSFIPGGNNTEEYKYSNETTGLESLNELLSKYVKDKEIDKQYKENDSDDER